MFPPTRTSSATFRNGKTTPSSSPSLSIPSAGVRTLGFPPQVSRGLAFPGWALHLSIQRFGFLSPASGFDPAPRFLSVAPRLTDASHPESLLWGLSGHSWDLPEPLGCVILSKLLHLSVPRFLVYNTGVNMIYKVTSMEEMS